LLGLVSGLLTSGAEHIGVVIGSDREETYEAQIREERCKD
jgi:hypothetical protein